MTNKLTSFKFVAAFLTGLLLSGEILAATQCNTTVTAIPDGTNATSTPGSVDVIVAYPVIGDVSSNILDVDLSLDISHTYVGDLASTVTSPTATSVLAFSRPGTTSVYGSPFGCANNDLQVTFDDEAASGTNIENICNVGPPAISGTYQPHDITTNPLSDFDGVQPNGNWTFNITDNAGNDTGSVNSACVTIQHAAVTFDKWVSTNATCSDTLDTLTVSPGTNVYYCYTVSNPGTEQLVLNSGNATDDQGLDISGLEGTYAPGASNTVVLGPYVAGGAELPLGTTVNIAQVTMTGDSVAFPNTQTLLTNETATVNVSVAPPASGIKNLYFQGSDSQNNPTLPINMSRTPLTATPAVARVRIRRQDTPRIWAQTPATQSTLSLSAGVTPVILQMRRNNQTQTRNMRVTIDYVGAATGTLGVVDVNVPTTNTDPINGLSNSVTRSFTFPVPTVAATLPANTQIRVIVDNSPTGGGGRAVFVYPYDAATGNTSQVQLNATTVINVDSVQFYDTAYPGGSPVTEVIPGSTVYVRAVVSDPFGSFDVTSSDITILDPTATPVVSGAAMTEVADSGIATKTYEYTYAIPLAGPEGSWTAQVTGNEGTEGTVSHTNAANLLVGEASLTVLKSALTISQLDANTNQYNIPGATILYNVVVTNTGLGTADNNSVSVTDPIPAGTRLCIATVGDCPSLPIFLQGSPTSNLTGVAFEYSQVVGVNACADASFVGYGGVDSGDGTDATITCIRQQPTGSMASSGGTFTIRFYTIIN